jgi:hypothetical protein
MVLHDASSGRTNDGVMARHVTDNGADRRALQAAFGAANGGKHRQRGSHRQGHYGFVHVHSFGFVVDTTRQNEKSCIRNPGFR